MPLVIGAGFGITGSAMPILGNGPGITGEGITGDGIGILAGGGLRFIGNVGPLAGGGTFIGSDILMRPGPFTGIGLGVGAGFEIVIGSGIGMLGGGICGPGAPGPFVPGPGRIVPRPGSGITAGKLMPGIIGSILAKLSRIFSKSTPGILNTGSGCGIAVALSSGGVTLPEPIKLPSDPIISVGLMPGPKPKSCGGIGL